jgi:hypothetical protein
MVCYRKDWICETSWANPTLRLAVTTNGDLSLTAEHATIWVELQQIQSFNINTRGMLITEAKARRGEVIKQFIKVGSCHYPSSGSRDDDWGSIDLPSRWWVTKMILSLFMVARHGFVVEHAVMRLFSSSVLRCWFSGSERRSWARRDMQSNTITYSEKDIASANLELFQVAHVCLLRYCSRGSKFLFCQCRAGYATLFQSNQAIPVPTIK